MLPCECFLHCFGVGISKNKIPPNQQAFHSLKYTPLFSLIPNRYHGQKKNIIWSTFLCFTLHVKIDVEQVSKLFPGII